MDVFFCLFFWSPSVLRQLWFDVLNTYLEGFVLTAGSALEKQKCGNA